MKIQKISLVVVSIYIIMIGMFSAGCSLKKIAEEKKAVKEFSADILSKTKDMEVKGKIYVTKDMVRVDMPEASVITNYAKNQAWTLLHKQKAYIKHEFKPEQAIIGVDRFPNETERIVVGSETIGNVNAKKYKISYSVDGKQQTVYQWIDEDTGVPLKTSSVDGDWSQQVSNVTAETPDPALFQVPDGYENVTGKFEW